MLVGMFDVGDSLAPALRSAQQQFDTASEQTARANATGAGSDAAMTATAHAALFSEALLAALHARLAEVKAATK
jgi:hypothetical protein